jgi:protein SCO1/2
MTNTSRTAAAASGPNRRGVLQGAAVCAAAFVLASAPKARAHPNHAGPGKQEGYVRRTGSYAVPDLMLRDTDGARVALRSSLAAAPVILDFIFTTCDTICPVTSLVFSQLQVQLADAHSPARLVSVSIDPEQDTPAALKRYGAKFGAGARWQMLTGTVAESILVQRAFDVYRGDKMNHQPVTFLRVDAGQPWSRLEGFATAQEIFREYQALLVK